ncbi:DUF6247 family protein [Gordonia sputi]
MAEYVRVDRTGPSIRAALASASPDELPDFEAEFHIALAEADEDFDTNRIEQVLTRWWGVAHLRLNPPTAEEMAAVARIATGNFGPEWDAEQARIDRELRDPHRIRTRTGPTITVFIEDVARLAHVLELVSDTKVPVRAFELHGRRRHIAHATIDNLHLTITDTGSITHAELTLQVADLTATHQRLRDATSDVPPLRTLDGRLTLALGFGAFGIFITDRRD